MNLCIGNVKLDNPYILAPMAGVCDLPFRLLCKEQGAALVCTEMVSAKAIFYNNKNTEELLTTDERERPVSVQLFGSDPKLMAEMAKKIEDRPFDILDINMGCPVPKVVNNGEGSALMKDPRLAGEIIYAVSHAVEKPVTVKIRAGFDENNINAVEIAKVAEENGAAAVAVHGRTREQYYSGNADWDIIRRVKDAVNISVIGNGDIKCYKDAENMMDTTGCDMVMIGRAVQGNPWIFKELICTRDGNKYEKPDADTIKQMILRHAKMLIDYKGEYIALREMRKHASWYTAGFSGAKHIRRMLNDVECFEQLKDVLFQIA